jgi:hypothetical protein
LRCLTQAYTLRHSTSHTHAECAEVGTAWQVSTCSGKADSLATPAGTTAVTCMSQHVRRHSPANTHAHPGSPDRPSERVRSQFGNNAHLSARSAAFLLAVSTGAAAGAGAGASGRCSAACASARSAFLSAFSLRSDLLLWCRRNAAWVTQHIFKDVAWEHKLFDMKWHKHMLQVCSPTVRHAHRVATCKTARLRLWRSSRPSRSCVGSVGDALFDAISCHARSVCSDDKSALRCCGPPP